MKAKLSLVISLLTVILAACNPNTYMRNMMDRMAPDDDKAFAEKYVNALRAHDFETATRSLDPQFVKPGIESNLTFVANLLDQGEPISRELVGCSVSYFEGKRRSSLTYQYKFTNSWVLTALVIDTANDAKTVFGVTINPIPKSIGEINAFTLSGKTVSHYVILALAIVVPVFIISTVVLCARTSVRRKWLWIIFILVGIAELKLDWTTGQIGFQPIAFQILGAGIAKFGAYAPWIVTVSFPLGAILFLRKRRKLAVAQPPSAAQPTQEVKNAQP